MDLWAAALGLNQENYIKIIQVFGNKILRKILNAQWNVWNENNHEDQEGVKATGVKSEVEFTTLLCWTTIT